MSTLRGLVAVSISLAACGGTSTTTTTSPGNTGGEVTGPPYAALFEPGKSVRYKRVSETTFYDPDDPKADPGGSVRDRSEQAVTCAVNARDFGEVKVAQLSCEGLADGDELAGELTAIYVADLRGVWRTDAAALPTTVEDARAAIGTQAKPLLAATPKAEEEKKEEEEGFGEMRKTSQAADGAWCVDWGSWGGDEGGGGICFAAGKGLTKVSSYWAGGSTKDDWFELVP
ncbi:MAG TPA: hypothetical protein VM261_27250 [Kofleriaceae bacterium]|nr:hypothetical protein [Kofleriaceae bacterium]